MLGIEGDLMATGSSWLRVTRLALWPEQPSLRYSLLVCAMIAAIGALRSLVRLGQQLDEWIYPGYRDVSVQAPVFIVGNPRSGTTLLHRLMALDDQFSYLQLYETLFPSVLYRRFVSRLGALDRLFGGPVERLIQAINRSAFRGWQGIHTTALEKAEEDEMLFLSSLRSPALAMAFPSLREQLPEAVFPDRLPATERTALGRAYRADLQRDVYADRLQRRPSTTLLAKNALAAGRLGLYCEALPDLRVVHLVRHPYQAIPSMISLLSRPWRVLRPEWYGNTPQSRELARLGFDYYRAHATFVASLPAERRLEVRYEDLVRDPQATVHSVYSHFGLELGDDYAKKLEAEMRREAGYRSSHSYDLSDYGLSREFVRDELQDLFEHYGWEG